MGFHLKQKKKGTTSSWALGMRMQWEYTNPDKPDCNSFFFFFFQSLQILPNIRSDQQDVKRLLKKETLSLAFVRIGVRSECHKKTITHD